MSNINLTITAKILFKIITSIFFVILIKTSYVKQNQYKVYYGLRRGQIHDFTLYGKWY